MSADKQSSSRGVLLCEDGKCREGTLEFLAEEPLLIRVEDKPYAVVMRTPGEEKAQAAGFCLAEGIVASVDDFHIIGYDELADEYAVDVWVTARRKKRIKSILKRRTFISQTSCGICGKELVKDLCQRLVSLDDGFSVELGRLDGFLRQLDHRQRYYHTTAASHASLLLDGAGSELAFAEDVGRHNALDKAIGKALLAGTLAGARVAVLSSRNSYELVQKAARARLPVMLSHSRPTAMAVKLARELNIALVFPWRDKLIVAGARERVAR